MKIKPKGGTICIQSGGAAAANHNERMQGIRDTLAGKKSAEAPGDKLTGQNGWTEVDGCPLYTERRLPRRRAADGGHARQISRSRCLRSDRRLPAIPARRLLKTAEKLRTRSPPAARPGRRRHAAGADRPDEEGPVGSARSASGRSRWATRRCIPSGYEGRQGRRRRSDLHRASTSARRRTPTPASAAAAERLLDRIAEGGAQSPPFFLGAPRAEGARRAFGFWFWKHDVRRREFSRRRTGARSAPSSPPFCKSSSGASSSTISTPSRTRGRRLPRLAPEFAARSGHGMAGLTRRHLELMPKLEICALHGVGLETSDLAGDPRAGRRADDRAGAVRRRRRSRHRAGAGLLPRDRAADRYVRAGNGRRARMPPGRKLTGMRAGVLGLGRIGVEVAHRLERSRRDRLCRPDQRASRPISRFDDAKALARKFRYSFPLRGGRPEGLAADGRRAIFWRRWVRAAFSSMSRAAGWSTSRAWSSALAKNGSARRGSMCFFDEPTCPGVGRWTMSC